MTANVFSPEIFQSEFRFRQFLKGDEAIAKISEMAKEQKPSKPSLYYNRWQVTWIVVTSPFRIFFNLFLECVSLLLKCVGAKNLSIRFHLYSKHWEKELSVLSSQCKYGEKLLLPSINQHDLSTSDVYLQKVLEISSIQDEWVKEKTFQKETKDNREIPITHVKFYSPGGVCRGAADWFLYLYQNTLGKFTSSEDHIRAVGSLFIKGAPREASILQSIDSPKLYEYDYQAECTDEQLSTKMIEDLPNGAFAVGFEKHKIGYIKINQDLGFIFDSNKGVILFNGENHFSEVIDYFKEYHKKYDVKVIQFQGFLTKEEAASTVAV